MTLRSDRNPGKGPAGRARWADETQQLVGRISNIGGQFIIRRRTVRVKYYTPNKILPPPRS